VRAKAGECTRLRCLSKECPLRPVDDIAKLNGVESGKPVDASREIDADDTEHMAIDDLMEEGDDEDELAEQQPQLVEPTKRDCIVDLWPFACAKEYYKHLIGGFSENETLSHLIILSTSAHPGPLFAAHDMRVMGHVYLDRVKTHCKKHGVQTLRDYLFRSYISEERAKIDANNKRVRTEELNFVSVRAPLEQTVFFSEVAPDVSRSAWRAKYDAFPESDALEAGVLELMSTELMESGLTVSKHNDTRRLTTKKALKEDERILIAPCLTFSSANGVRECMNAGGNAALLDGPLLHVQGLQTPAMDTTMSVFAVLVGAARWVTDYRGISKHPNAVFR